MISVTETHTLTCISVRDDRINCQLYPVGQTSRLISVLTKSVTE